MKHILERYLAGTVLAALTLLPASCIKEDVADTGKATVTMTVRTRATTSTTGSTLADNEQMRHLRVIMAKAGTDNIIYNEVRQIEPDETSTTITLSEVKVDEKGTDFDFYAIANESPFINDVDELEGKSLDLSALKERIISANYNATNTQIAQSCFVTQKITPDDDNQVDMQLSFAVAKVCLKFINQSGSVQYLGDISLPASNPEKGYLFPQEQGNLPTDLTYRDVMLYQSTPSDGSAPTYFQVDAGTADNPTESATLTAYLYPGDKGNDAYTLQTVREGEAKTFTLSLSGSNVTKIDRGTQLNVTITLLPGEKEEAALDCGLVEWTDAQIDIPFN